MQLEEHVRDVQGDINKDVKQAVRLHTAALWRPKDSNKPSMPARTEQDCKAAQDLLAGASPRAAPCTEFCLVCAVKSCSPAGVSACMVVPLKLHCRAFSPL